MLKLTTSCDDEVLNTDLHYMTSIDFDIKISLTIIFIYACNIHAKNKDDIYEVTEKRKSQAIHYCPKNR